MACPKSTRAGGRPLVLESHDDGDNLECDGVDVHVRSYATLRLLVVQQGAHELAGQLVALDEEVVERIVLIEALGSEDEIEARQDACLRVVATQLAQAGQCESEWELPLGIDGLHPVALGDHLPQEALLRAEVVEEPRCRHPDPIGERCDAGASIALRGEELDRGVDDLLPAQVASGLPAVLVGSGVLPVWRALCPRETLLFPIIGAVGHGVIGLGVSRRVQEGRLGNSLASGPRPGAALHQFNALKCPDWSPTVPGDTGA
jgi:hypothetical protein